jgi:hypothetical protein
MSKPLIFGIGMNKTGTSSLTNALYILGFPCLHSAKTVKATSAANRAKGKPPLHGLTDKYAAFCDSPINYMFKELDEAYPGSRFILTVRDFNDWVISRIAQFRGTPQLHKDKWLKHVNNVRSHFEGREGDLLEYNLCGGDGWSPLCRFLEVPIPDQPFPWKNKTGFKRKARVAMNLRGAGG